MSNIDYNNLSIKERKKILKKYKKGTKFTITDQPTQWSSSLNGNNPFDYDIVYPYKGKITNIIFDTEPNHFAIDDGIYGWSLTSLLKCDCIIIDELNIDRKKKLKKINKLNPTTMKLFKVSIDNNPGGWKSGEDPHVLVFAENKVEAIKKVKDGWEYKWDYTDEGVILTYGKNFKKEHSYVNDKSQLSASEIKFDGYDIHIKPIRKAKLDRINKHSERNNEEV
jgi:hypothetical protein